MYIIIITDDKNKDTGKAYGFFGNRLFELGAPLADHTNYTFIRMPQAVFDNWTRSVESQLATLKTFFNAP